MQLHEHATLGFLGFVLIVKSLDFTMFRFYLGILSCSEIQCKFPKTLFFQEGQNRHDTQNML